MDNPITWIALGLTAWVVLVALIVRFIHCAHRLGDPPPPPDRGRRP